MSEKATFAERLKSIRTKKGYSQYKLADIMQCARTTISAYELGRNEPSYSDLIKLSNLFGVSAEWLMGNTNDPLQKDNKNSDGGDPDIITIQRLRQNLGPVDREKMMKLLRLTFEEAFPKEKNKDGKEQED